ncbi:sigma-70 family RNA polymerase sigma factor [Lacticaseibacillus brantae]|uniref:RNA polymerase sigma-70 region 2 domain-containing protein n=1 Tax=Lacticaseibacillus brantae DSM 23927 TaxID=1423727 RepID=A0A0R2B0D7_9LACO|nr:sigma-70 family RNA polymerase sigma factor [Lacticaseibacillus brantae]KRM71476.1 hypothetical protein FC34_GL001591 [Lacticaseibacillus brantae DSM 23927]
MEQLLHDLIRQAANDSTAFDNLFTKYLPLVRTVIRTYHLREFDRDDWLQESRIAMLKAAQHFDGSSGSQFGAYYRMVLLSHIRSLLRRHYAQKRAADAQSFLIEQIALERLLPGGRLDVAEEQFLMRVELPQFYQQLSTIEQTILLRLMQESSGTFTAKEQRLIRQIRQKLIRFTSQ